MDESVYIIVRTAGFNLDSRFVPTLREDGVNRAMEAITKCFRSEPRRGRRYEAHER